MTWRPLAGVTARAGSTPDGVALTDVHGDLTWAELLAAGRATDPARHALPAVGEGSWRHVLVRVIAAATRGGVVAVPDDTWPAAVRSSAQADLDASTADAEVLVWTSGSTGRPRPVRRSAASWDRSVDLVSDLTGIGPSDVVLLTGPPASTLQLYAAWHAMSVGATLVAPDGDVMVRRTATALHGVPAVVAGVVADAASWPSVRTVVVAGAEVPADLRREVLELRWRWTAYYGAAELSFVAADVGAGLRPCPEVDLRLVEPVVVGPDGSRTGLLEVRSPYLALPGSSREATGSWRTAGDVVTLAPDGSLVVRGRGDTAVTTGGHTVVVEGVETVVRRWPGVSEVAVVGSAHPRLGETVTAVVVGDLTRMELDVLARQHLPAPSRPRRWWIADRLPYTSGGKLDRAAVRAAVREQPADDTVPFMVRPAG